MSVKFAVINGKSVIEFNINESREGTQILSAHLFIIVNDSRKKSTEAHASVLFCMIFQLENYTVYPHQEIFSCRRNLSEIMAMNSELVGLPLSLWIVYPK